MLMTNGYLDQIFSHSLNTAIAAVVIVICVLVFYIIFARKAETKKQKKRIRSRLVYVASFVFVLVLIRIWVEGFTHLFTMLSLVAAGLVVTNKETIMNLVGWLIINWRGLFTEGDFIQVQNYIGYVESIRPLYFKLYETTQLDRNQATGKTIKIPNGTIINNAVVTFSQDANLALYRLTFVIYGGADQQKALQAAQETISAILTEHYQDDVAFNRKAIRKKNQTLASMIDLTPRVALKINADKDKTLSIQIEYYCYPTDAQTIEQAFWDRLITYHQKHNIGLLPKA